MMIIIVLFFVEFITTFYVYNSNGFKGFTTLNFLKSLSVKDKANFYQPESKITFNLAEKNPFIYNPPDGVHIKFHPFLDYTGAHGVNSDNIVSPTKFLDFFGYRNRHNIYFEERKKNDFLILMTGGSECAGFSHPNQTISEYVQVKLQKIAKIKVRVINLCMNSYVLAHEIQTYVHLIYNFKPNLVISHSGWNDIIYGLLLDINFINAGLIYNKWQEQWLKKLYGNVNKETEFAFQNFDRSKLPFVVQSYWKQAQKYNHLVTMNNGKFVIGLQAMNSKIVKDSMYDIHSFTHKGMNSIKKNKPSNINLIDFTKDKNLEFFDGAHTLEKSVQLIGDKYLTFIKKEFPEIINNK